MGLVTPNAPDYEGPDIRIQRIRVTDEQSNESTECAVVVIKWPAVLNLDPFHVSQGRSTQPVPFETDFQGKVDWLVYGEGAFDGNIYTSPDTPVMPIAVVAADDGDIRTGYAIVEFSQGRTTTSAALQTWEAISTFELKTLTAPSCYGNGWQQICVEVSVAAADVNGEAREISDADLATLKFAEVYSNSDIRFLGPDEEALYLPKKNSVEESSTAAFWAVNRNQNTITPQGGQLVESVVSAGQIRRKRFYFHCRKDGQITIHAFIQNAITYQIVWSEDIGELGKVTLLGIKPPPFFLDSYSFTRKRISGDDSPSDGDEFVYVDNSADYWTLEGVKIEGRPEKFTRLRVASEKTKSSLLWASHLHNDRMASYTGFSFRSSGNAANEKLLFDGVLSRAAKERNHKLPKLASNSGPSTGEFMISVHRVDQFKYWQRGYDIGYPEALETPVEVELLDVYGNAHPLKFEFYVTEQEKGMGLATRDKVQLTLGVESVVVAEVGAESDIN